MNDSATLQTTWAQQRKWSSVAGHLKSEIVRARTFILVCVVATAVLETAATQLKETLGKDAGTPKMLAIFGAVTAAAAAFFQTLTRGRERLKKWTRARSTSEALKENVYRYLTGTGKYAKDAETALISERERILQRVTDLLSRAEAQEPAEKPLPEVRDIASYVKARVAAQINDYYLVHAKRNARLGLGWRTAQTVLLFVSAILGALAVYAPDLGLGAWVSVITTVTGAFGAHIEAERYDRLAVSYGTTAARLQSLSNEWSDGLSKRTLTPEEQAGFIDRCEQAISVENEAWMAGWVKEA